MDIVGKSKNTLIVHILVFIQGIVLIPLIVKNSGVDVYGMYVLLITILSFSYGISSFGYGFNASRYLPSARTKEEKEALFVPQFVFQLISVIVISLLLVIFIYIGSFYELWNLKDVWLWALPIYLISQCLFSQGTIYYRYTHRVYLLNKFTILEPYLFISIAICYFAIIGNLTVNVLLLTNILSLIILAVIIQFMVFKEIDFKLTIPKFDIFKRDMLYGLPLLLAFMIDTVVISGDRFFIASFMTIEDVGYYSIAYSLGMVMLFVPKAISVVITPIVSMYIDNYNTLDAKKIFINVIRLYLLVTIPFVAGAVVLGGDLLYIISNKQTSLESLFVLPIIGISSIFYGLNYIYNIVFFVNKDTAKILKVNIMMALFNIILNFVFFMLFLEIEVAAISTLLSYLIGYVYIIRNVGTFWKIGITVSWFLRVLFHSVLMALGVLIVKNLILLDTVLMVVFYIIFGIAIYISSIYIDKKMARNEINLILKTIKEGNKA